MRKPNGLFRKGEVYWSPQCKFCKNKMELKYHKCYGCRLYFAFAFQCEEHGYTLTLTETCPNCGYVH